MTYHNITTIEKSVETTRFRGEPMVMLPLQSWKKIEDIMEEFEMHQSLRFKRTIKKSRIEIKKGLVYEFDATTGMFAKGKSK